ncbi:MAG: response regulator [Polyangiaceae bacterium]
MSRAVTTRNVHRGWGSPLRVLCVDDDPLVLESTVRALTGFDIISVGDSRQALDRLINQRDIDVIVSDVMMPNMTGPDLYVACYRHSPELARRFVFVTGDIPGARELIDAALRSAQGAGQPLPFGPPTLLAKPIQNSALVVAIASVAASLPAPSAASQSVLKPRKHAMRISSF